MKRIALLCGATALLLASAVPVGAQDQILDIGRPRLAMANDGSFAMAWEARIGDASFSEWKALVQRYTAGGTPVGQPYVFEARSCSGLSIWLSDFMQNIELAYRSDGALVVLMQHTGEFQLGGDGVASAEANIAVIDASGNVVDLQPNGPCVVYEAVFPGGSRQDRPRMALTPDNVMFMTVDGFFQQSNFRNVAIRVLDAGLNEVQGLDELIPHTDPGSQQAFHMFPDIATNGALLLSTWQRCPIIDNQGNASECDIGAQFAQISSTGLTLVGGNLKVNSGDPPGTLNLWPAAAMAPDGASVIAWIDTRDGNAGEVYGQRFDPNGQPVGGNFRISNGQGEICPQEAIETPTLCRPEVAIRNDGSFLVAWTDKSGSSFHARGRRFDAAGMQAGPPFLLNGQAGLQTAVPHVTSNGSAFFYTYVGVPTGGTVQIFSNTPAITSNEAAGAPRVSDLELDLYPNPFVRQGQIAFTLHEAVPVTIDLYDALGRRVRHEPQRLRHAGEHRIQIEGRELPPGVYIMKLQAGGRTEVRTWVRSE